MTKLKKASLLLGSALAVAIVAVSLTFSSGCTTTTTTGGGGNGTNVVVTPNLSPAQVEAIGQVLQVTTQYGVQLAVAQNTNNRAYFQLAVQTLNALLTTNALDTASIDAALQNINVAGLSDQTLVRSAILAALSTYSVLEGQVVSAKLDEAVYLRPLLAHFIAGIQAGSALPLAAPRLSLRMRPHHLVWPHPIAK